MSARLYYAATTGQELAFSANDAADARVQLSPPQNQDPASPLVFDETTNAGLIAAIQSNPAGTKVVGGVVKINNVNQTVQPDATATTDRKALLTGAANAIATNNTFIGLASPTAAQVAAEVKALAQQNNQLIKRLVQLSQ
jgi:hypothetical protein